MLPARPWTADAVSVELARRGKTGGRPPLLSAEQTGQALQLHESGTPVARLARQFKVSRATIYRYLSLAKSRAAAADNIKRDSRLQLHLSDNTI